MSQLRDLKKNCDERTPTHKSELLKKNFFSSISRDSILGLWFFVKLQNIGNELGKKEIYSQ